ncbi:hypothetical protein Nepgr_025638 [Nepenthes gracilis]|uniref:Uncharacterized protein n=1 Tax=Nepenthes gracilis TaxID=150966 RepID=A0AAD3T5G2_NEPGR|nr:hypothetical protein Nepgr_025638 [Nepenthes gracilis]
MVHLVRAAVRPLCQRLPLPPLTQFYHVVFCYATISTPKSRGSERLSSAAAPSSRRRVQFLSRGLRSPEELVDEENELESDSLKKSRNEKKREARRAVRWGMELASFSTPQIKRILRLASLEQEVFDALMLVKRLGSDVREGKRRQFNHIGKLLRDAKPDLLDALIQATKDGDQSKLQAVSGSKEWFKEHGEEEAYESESEEVEEESHRYITIASEWYNGLLNNDIRISKEVYSVHGVDFNRQELRKLVREVHSLQDCGGSTEENDEVEEENSELMAAKSRLTRFLRSLAKRIQSEQY